MQKVKPIARRFHALSSVLTTYNGPMCLQGQDYTSTHGSDWINALKGISQNVNSVPKNYHMRMFHPQNAWKIRLYPNISSFTPNFNVNVCICLYWGYQHPFQKSCDVRCCGITGEYEWSVGIFEGSVLHEKLVRCFS